MGKIMNGSKNDWGRQEKSVQIGLHHKRKPTLTLGPQQLDPSKLSVQSRSVRSFFPFYFGNSSV